MSHLSFYNFGNFYQFGPFKGDLSGSTVWPQVSGFQKLVNMTICGILGIFDELVHSKCKHNECEFFGDFQTLCSKLMIEDEEESFAFFIFWAPVFNTV